MKSRLLKFCLVSLILLIMIVTAFLLVKPIINILNSRIEQVKDMLFNKVADMTGLSLEYESIEPDIFVGLRITGLSACDADKNEKVIEVKKISVNYKLWKLLKGDFTNAIKSVSVKDVNVFIDNRKQEYVLSKIQNMFGSNETEELLYYIPFPVSIQKVNVIYSFEDIELSLLCDSLKVSPQIKTSRIKVDSTTDSVLELQYTGTVGFTSKTKLLGLFNTFNAAISIQAIITPMLENSFAKMKLLASPEQELSFPGLEFLAEYSEKKINLKAFSSGKPFELNGSLDLETSIALATITTENFDPFQLVKVNNENDLLTKYKGFILSGVYGISFNSKTNELLYNADGCITIPKGILPEDFLPGVVKAEIRASGNGESISIEKLSTDSQNLNALFSGTLNLKTLFPQGTLNIEKYKLPNGKVVNCEIYIDPETDKALCFIPQLCIDNDQLTAVQVLFVPQKNSFDFSIEAYDYSHVNSDIPGQIIIDGSILLDSGVFIQSGISLENFYIDSIAHLAENFLPENSIPVDTYTVLQPYILSLSIFVSSDLHSISYNSPYAVIANTKKDNEMSLFSFDGNETTIQVSKFDLLYAGQEFHASFSADSDNNYSQIYFSSLFTLNSLPYSFSGVYKQNEYISITGDYELDLHLDISKKKELRGGVNLNSIPLSVNDFLFSISTQCEFEYTSPFEWQIAFNKTEISENSGKIKIEPRLSFSGTATRYGIMLDSFAYGDTVSFLNGNCTVSWIYSNGIIESVKSSLELTNGINNESIFVEMQGSNPFGLNFTDDDFFRNFFISAQGDINEFPTARFLEKQDGGNFITASITVIGSLDNPYISCKIPHASLRIDGKPMDLSGSLDLEDKQLNFKDISATFEVYKVKNISGSYSFDKMEGKLTAVASVNMKPLLFAESPIELTIKNKKDENDFLNLNAELVLKDLISSFTDPIKDYKISYARTPGRNDFSVGSGSNSMSGWLLDSGELFASTKKDFPILFTAEGTVIGQSMDIQVNDIVTKISTISGLLSMDVFSIYKGSLYGNLHLSGLIGDPDFSGIITVSDFELGVPAFVPEHLLAKKVLIKAEQNKFIITNTDINYNNNTAVVDFEFALNRWAYSYMDIKVKTKNNSLIPAKCTFPMIDVTGKAGCDLSIYIGLDGMSLIGVVNAENAIAVLTNSTSQGNNDNNNYQILIDLAINTDSRTQIYYPSLENPILRGLASAEKPLYVKLNTGNGTFELSGDLMLKGGEILYLNRNFYLKEGRVYLDASQDSFDPKITLRAEIRERDEIGEFVKVILSVDDQRLSVLSPVLSSEPNMSQEEIRLLLGEALVAESGSTASDALGQVIASGFDFFIQSSFVRVLENQLRELCNFDIFSFRTPFLQKALLQVFKTGIGNVDIGNYLDNTTVYIGKYIGTKLYLDAMFRLVYNSKGSSSSEEKQVFNLKNLVFRPEVGLELPTPFTTIRWSLAPDITALAQNLWVPYTSISLSWKITY